jgi:hypothetical protein
VLDHLSAELRLRPGDEWRLTQFSADALGVRFHLAATITNATQLASWNWPRAAAEPVVGPARLGQLLRALERIKFSGPPALRVAVSGDAAKPEQFTAEAVFTAPQFTAPWGEAARLTINAALSPASGTNGVLNVTARLALESPRSEWAHAGNADLEARLRLPLTPAGRLDAEWTATVASVETRWAKAQQARLSGHTEPSAGHPAELQTKLTILSTQLEHPAANLRDARFDATVFHSLTNGRQFRADGRLAASGLASKWADAETLLVNARLSAPAHDGPSRADSSWAWWADFESLAAEWECRVSDFRTPKLPVEEFFCAGLWRAPELTLTNLQARLHGGQLSAAAGLNVATRDAHAKGALDFDFKELTPLLTAKTQRFLSQYTWTTPPKITAEARLKLPAWTNAAPEWRAEVLPSVRVDGEFEAHDGGAFRGVWVDFARSRFTLSNAVWHLPDLVAHRPDGQVELSYTGDMRTRDFMFQVRSRLDPNALEPVLDEKAGRALGFFQFTSPPVVEGEIRGQWSAPERLGFAARVAATNFTFRGETCGVFTAAVEFTNQFLRASDILVRRDEGEIRVPALGFDIPGHAVWLTNATSTV